MSVAMTVERGEPIPHQVRSLHRAIAFAERHYLDPLQRSVMVSFMGGHNEHRTLRHLKLFRDKGGLYVRTGKRGQQKKYLRDMAGARIVDMAMKLAVFHEVE